MKKMIVLLLIILAAIVIFMIVKGDNLPVKNDAEEIGGVSGQFGKLAADALVVRDQRPGDIVILSAVNLSKSGFVIIRRDVSGKPGDIIGVSEFLVTGAYSQIDVGTTESILNGVRYYAELSLDNGDGIFDPKDDKVVRWNGEDVTTSFVVDQDAKDPRNVDINY